MKLAETNFTSSRYVSQTFRSVLSGNPPHRSLNEYSVVDLKKLLRRSANLSISDSPKQSVKSASPLDFSNTVSITYPLTLAY